MQKMLRRMEIEPADNGGHTITRHFKSQPVMRKGGMNSGMSMDHPESETDVFGPGDRGRMLAHIGKHLGIKGAAEETGEQEHAG